MHCIITTLTKHLDVGVRRDIDEPISGSKDDLAAKRSIFILNVERPLPRERKTN